MATVMPRRAPKKPTLTAKSKEPSTYQAPRLWKAGALAFCMNVPMATDYRVILRVALVLSVHRMLTIKTPDPCYESDIRSSSPGTISGILSDAE